MIFTAEARRRGENKLSAEQAISGQRSAISLNRAPRARRTPKGTRSTDLRCVVFLGSPYGAPAHRKVPGARPEGGADRMSAPDLRGRIARKIRAGTPHRRRGGARPPANKTPGAPAPSTTGGSTGTASDLFADARGLAFERAQIKELGAAHVALALELDLGDRRAVERGD